MYDHQTTDTLLFDLWNNKKCHKREQKRYQFRIIYGIKMRPNKKMTKKEQTNKDSEKKKTI